MSSKLSKSINLLDPVMAPEDIWTKIYDWVTKIGKFLLVFVAVIVLGVFFARFFLDKQNNDLTNNEINPKVEMLSQTQLRQNELKYRNYQTLLNDVSEVIKNQKINSTRLSVVLDSIPQNFIMKSISFVGDKVSLSLEAESLEDIGRYTSLLNSNQLYTDVSSSISKSGSQSGVVDFSVSFSFASATQKTNFVPKTN